MPGYSVLPSRTEQKQKAFLHHYMCVMIDEEEKMKKNFAVQMGNVCTHAHMNMQTNASINHTRTFASKTSVGLKISHIGVIFDFLS